MPDVTHRQFDELPVRDFTLSFDTAANTWPALVVDNTTPANSDKVTMVVNKGGTATTVKLSVVDAAARTVRWSPGGALVSTAGKFPFVIRVTQASGNSYTHPAVGTWNLVIEAAAVTTDVTDPA